MQVYFHTDTIGPLDLIAKLSLVFSHVFNFCKSLADQGFLFAASCHKVQYSVTYPTAITVALCARFYNASHMSNSMNVPTC